VAWLNKLVRSASLGGGARRHRRVIIIGGVGAGGVGVGARLIGSSARNGGVMSALGGSSAAHQHRLAALIAAHRRQRRPRRRSAAAAHGGSAHRRISIKWRSSLIARRKRQLGSARPRLMSHRLASSARRKYGASARLARRSAARRMLALGALGSARRVSLGVKISSGVSSWRRSARRSRHRRLGSAAA